jgi:GAF domain-containing protein
MSGGRRVDVARLVAALRSEATSCDVVDRLLTGTTEALECGDAAVTLTVLRPGDHATVATDPGLVRLADLQAHRSLGPAFEVASAIRPHALVTDVGTDNRWPQWAAAAARSGARSLLCVPLTCGDLRLGTVTAYDARVGHFTAYDVATLRLLAGVAGSAIASAQDHDDLWQVIDARRTVGYAQGILMERESLDSGRALAALRLRCDQQRLTLDAVAHLLVGARGPLD